MSDAKAGALALYKGQPALVVQANRKLDIQLADGQSVSVRPKDITLLHPGPLSRLSDLRPTAGEPLVAWELLQGQVVDLETLSDLIFGEYTPSSAWATWQMVEDGLLFRGTANAIEINDAQTRNMLHARREARAAEEAAWSAFEARVANKAVISADSRYLSEVEAVALGQSERSRVLESLGVAQTPEAAHTLLLATGYWDEAVNPYPSREGVALTPPISPLPELSEEKRLDLTHMTALAIDDEGSSDPDDAMSYEDGWLWVHVADAAALVLPDSAADLEARSRGANLYLPEGTIRMLPPEATIQLGLGLQERSPAVSFGILLDDQANVADLRIESSWVNVERMTYDEALARLDSEPLATLGEVADRLHARRLAQGAVEIDLPEVRIRVAEDGQVSIKPLPPIRSREIVLEAMLITGEAIGRFALENNIPLPYTAQDSPYDYDVDLAAPAGMFARRRSMQRSRQQTTPGAHAGLGLEVYVQATSPLRRYLDLIVHQQLRAFLRGEAPLDSNEILLRIGAAAEPSSATRYAERMSNSHWTCVYLLQNPDWRGEGIVVDDRNGTHTILIPDLAIETTMRLGSGTVLNTRVELAVTGVSLPQREAHFRLAK